MLPFHAGLFAGALAAATAPPEGFHPLREGSIAVSGGALQPLGDLASRFPASPAVGLDVRASYLEPVFLRAGVQALRLGGDDPVRGLFFHAGYDLARGPWAAGAGIALLYVATERAGRVVRLIDDGETDFGATVHAQIPLARLGGFRLGLAGRLWLGFTHPRPTWIGSTGLALEHRLW